MNEAIKLLKYKWMYFLYEDYIRLATYNAAGAKPEFSEDVWHRTLDNKVYANAYVQFYKTNTGRG